jgi:hypothetical protein
MHQEKKFPSPITFITLISIVSAVYEQKNILIPNVAEKIF